MNSRLEICVSSVSDLTVVKINREKKMDPTKIHESGFCWIRNLM